MTVTTALRVEPLSGLIGATVDVPLDELLEESLDELGWPIDAAPVQRFRHFRSEDLKYVFEHVVPDHGDAEEAAATWLIAYETTFRELGDVSGEEDED